MRVPRYAPHLATRRAGRPLGALPVLVVLLMGLAGCMRVQRSFTINGDGTGVYVLTVGIHEPTPGDPQSIPSNIVSVMEAFGVHVRQQGGSDRRYDEQGYAYWAFTRPFSSISQADAQLQDDPRQYDTSHTPLLYQDALHVSTRQSFGATTYRVTGTISLADPSGNAQQGWQDASESLTITMTSGISAHRGGVQNGTSVTYTIAYNQAATVDVTGSVSHLKGTNLAALVLVIALAAFTLGALGIWLVYRATRPAGRKGG